MNFKQYYNILFSKGDDKSSAQNRSNERYRRAAWTSITTAGARGISILAGLISVPLTINYLGAERFGLWMTISASVTILQFADFGIGNGVLNKISEAHGRDDNAGIKSIISNGIAMSLFIAALVIGAFFVISSFFSWSTVFNATSPLAMSEAGPTTAVLVTMIALNIILGIVNKVNGALQRGYINGTWQIIGSLLGLLFLIISINVEAGLPVLVASYMSGPVAATLMNGIFLFFYSHSWAKPSISKLDISIARGLAGLGIWFFLFQLIVSLNNAVPNLVISHVLGLDQVAFFSIGLKLASVAVILQTVILTPLWPAYAEAKTRGDWKWIKKTLMRSIKLSGLIGLLASAVTVVFGADIIVLWINAESVPPHGVLWGLGVWVLLCSFYGPFTMFLNGMGKIRVQVIYGVVLSVFMIVTTIFLTKQFHVAGAAWAFGAAVNLPSICIAGYLSYRMINQMSKRALS